MAYLVSASDMALLDRETIQTYGIPARTLMEVAGRAVASVCAAQLPVGSRITVACGGGHNGGDGLVAARALGAQGYEVHVFMWALPDRIKADAQAALQTLEKTGEATLYWMQGQPTQGHAPEDMASFQACLSQSHLVIDALVGIGLESTLRAPMAEAIDLINTCAAKVVSVDIPSGVHTDTGRLAGPAIRAAHTVTFGYAKLGHYLHPGAQARGTLSVVDIGIPRHLPSRHGIPYRLLQAQDGPALLKPRQPDSHKGTFGHVVVVAGSPTSPGAAVLCLKGALRSGAGLVSWATSSETLLHAPSLPPEVMLRLRKADTSPRIWAEQMLSQATALVVGPGLTTHPEQAQMLEALLQQVQQAGIPVCWDADALNLMALHPDLFGRLCSPAVVTPHPKEMARLTKKSVESIQNNRVEAAASLARTRPCVVVLKGAGTVVASPDGTVAVVEGGNPGLATGGTGDVLAGILGGLLAQGLDAFSAAQLGVLWHATAGDQAAQTHGQAGLCATDVLESLCDVLHLWNR